MELGFCITAMKLADQVTTVAACLLVLSFLGLWLEGWFQGNHSVSYLLFICPRPRTLPGSSALDVMPLQTVEMAEVYGFLCSMIHGPSFPAPKNL
jgi:hypothetical protein